VPLSGFMRHAPWLCALDGGAHGTMPGIGAPGDPVILRGPENRVQ
jgi:hypothetical protein